MFVPCADLSFPPQRNVTPDREWPYAQCLAFAHVTYVTRDKDKNSWRSSVVYVESLEANLEHSNECIIARRTAAPPLTLHPAIREQAQQLLAMRVSAAEVMLRSIQLVEKDFGGQPIIGPYHLNLTHKVS